MGRAIALQAGIFGRRGRSTQAPDTVPARMINETLYCERLMYLEWAQGEFRDNVFTVDGRAVHTRPDTPQGQLPFPPESPTASPAPDPDEPTEEEPRPYTARSVWLTSEKLALTAKIDVVEGEDGRVTPVEYKRGQAPEVPEGAYLPERAQLCAQVLLLREHGFVCDGGDIYFAGSRRRVPIAIDGPLIEATLHAVARARELTARGEIPPPLEDSPKCNGCSLVGICLPDEVHHLRRLEAERVAAQLELGLVLADAGAELAPAVRRLHPARDDKVPLYVQSYSGRISLDGDRLVVETKEGKSEARLPLTSQVCVYGNVQITTPALGELMEREVPVCFFSYGGWFRGMATGLGSKNIELRMAQHEVLANPSRTLPLAAESVAAKILNARTMLRRNHRDAGEVLLNELSLLARKAEAAESLESLLGLEGAGARAYFQAFSGMLKPTEKWASFDFTGRNRRPPMDPVNALLSFAYGLLTKEWVLTLTAVGLEPLLGFYHQPRYGRAALALDLMEEFRPLIADSVVLQVINTGVVGETDFITAPTGCAMKPGARKRLIQAYERRMDQEVTHPVFGYKISYRRVLEVQARLLSRHFLGELESFPHFRTR